MNSLGITSNLPSAEVVCELDFFRPNFSARNLIFDRYSVTEFIEYC